MRAQDLERLLFNLRKMGIYKHKKYSLSNADITLLFSVWFGPENGIKPSSIAERLDVTLPAITHKMNTLVEQGYLTRRDSKTDQRVSYVLLTEKGLSYVESIKDDYYQRMLKLVKHLGERDTAVLFRILTKISKLGKL
ncbi:MAG: MarR family transcriptional regulator [Acholeplasmataceae bacterium]|nr:MarR family transcriptional regulator [Acholeplasmataceae bacterium]